MSDGTKIEWCDATVNAINGCSLASPGCTNCYAMKQAHRFPVRQGLTVPSKGGMVWTGEVRLSETALMQPLRWRRPRTIFWNAHGDTFHDKVPDEWIDRMFAVMALTPQHKHLVLTKRSARMRDWFGNDRSSCVAYRINEVAAEHGISVGGAVVDDEDGFWWPLPNVWLGVSVEDQARADERIPDLLATPAAGRFLSCEPLLGPVDLTSLDVNQGWDEMDALNPINISAEWRDWCEGDGRPDADGDPEVLAGFVEQYGREPDGRPIHPTLDGVIVGGESGPRARPMHPDWARSLRDQCAVAGVDFHFKQWGEYRPAVNAEEAGSYPVVVNNRLSLPHGDPRRNAMCESGLYHMPHQVASKIDGSGQFAALNCAMFKAGKKAAGRLLDGAQHDALPWSVP